MKQAEFSIPARQDLAEIARFVHTQSGLDMALHVISAIEAQADKLARNPGMGRSRDDVRKAIRSHAVWDYLLFYREIPTGIEVLRILHGARDITTDDISRSP